jgi:hypothetical protein
MTGAPQARGDQSPRACRRPCRTPGSLAGVAAAAGRRRIRPGRPRGGGVLAADGERGRRISSTRWPRWWTASPRKPRTGSATRARNASTAVAAATGVNAMPSIANGMPNTSPNRPASPGHSNPIWNDSTVPDAAPTAKVRPAAWGQRRASLRAGSCRTRRPDGLRTDEPAEGRPGATAVHPRRVRRRVPRVARLMW